MLCVIYQTSKTPELGEYYWNSWSDMSVKL